MGMFDEITCKYPLPDPYAQDEIFQTKDFDCALDHYIIDESGKLFLQEYEMRSLGTTRKIGEFEFPDTERVNTGLKPADYTGSVNFYTTLEEFDGEWLEYNAEFQNGQLTAIQRTFRNNEAIDRLLHDLNNATKEDILQIDTMDNFEKLQALDLFKNHKTEDLRKFLRQIRTRDRQEYNL